MSEDFFYYFSSFNILFIDDSLVHIIKYSVYNPGKIIVTSVKFKAYKSNQIIVVFTGMAETRRPPPPWESRVPCIEGLKRLPSHEELKTNIQFPENPRNHERKQREKDTIGFSFMQSIFLQHK